MRQLTVFDELIIDNFAGGGGASTGIEAALGRIVDIAINHNAEAVEMHKANHPHTKHYCEDVWSVDPLEVTSGKKVALAWFSPDCKHFSKAKGAAPREKKIRGLAWVAIRWAATVKPRVIVLENVEEFVTWGPLTKDGQPCPKRKGQTFRSFKNAFIRLGYQVEHRELIAYEYGTPTTRKRFFMIARCDGQPIVWPTPTHGKPSNPRVKSGELKPWRTAAECIDWSIPCPSIFERERPLAEATLRRIAKGIQKYVIDAKNPFIVTCNHSGDGFRGQGLSEPFKTVTSSRDAHGLVVPTLVQTGYGERPGQEPRVPGLDKPLGTAMAQGIKHGLVAATLMHYRDAPGEQIRNVDLEAPLGTVTAGGVQHALAVATLLKHYGGNNKAAGSDLNEPMHTVTTQDHHSLLTANLVRHFGTSNGADVDAPVGTITTEGAGKTAVVVSHLTRFRGDNVSDVTEPIPTIVASGVNIGEVRAFLAKYYGDDENHQSVDEPLHTIPTRDRFALVTIQNVDYVIVDIGMRMLKPHELFKAQGFPDDYIITPEFKGKPLTKTAQVKMCGNSVPPPMAEAIVRANVQLAEKTARRA